MLLPLRHAPSRHPAALGEGHLPGIQSRVGTDTAEPGRGSSSDRSPGVDRPERACLLPFSRLGPDSVRALGTELDLAVSRDRLDRFCRECSDRWAKALVAWDELNTRCHRVPHEHASEPQLRDLQRQVMEFLENEKVVLNREIDQLNSVAQEAIALAHATLSALARVSVIDAVLHFDPVASNCCDEVMMRSRDLLAAHTCRSANCFADDLRNQPG